MRFFVLVKIIKSIFSFFKMFDVCCKRMIEFLDKFDFFKEEELEKVIKIEER